MDYWNRFRSRFSVVAILDELHREHCSLARVEGGRDRTFFSCAPSYTPGLRGTLKRRWLVYLKLGLLGDDGFLRKEEPRRAHASIWILHGLGFLVASRRYSGHLNSSSG